MDIGLRGFVAAGLFAVTNIVLAYTHDVTPERGAHPATSEAIDPQLTPAGSAYTLNCTGTASEQPACRLPLELAP